MKQRLIRYQTFKTARKGALKYKIAFKDAQIPKDYQQMLISHLRLVEVMQEVPYSLESLKSYQKSALLLVELGRDDAALRDYRRFCLMLLAGGELDGQRILQPETVAMMTRNQLPEELDSINILALGGPGVGFGLGFSVRVRTHPTATPAPVGDI